MTRQMIVDARARQIFVTRNCCGKDLCVVLDVLRDEIKPPVCDHQLLTKLCIDTSMQLFQRLRPTGCNQRLVEFSSALNQIGTSSVGSSVVWIRFSMWLNW